MKFLWIACLKLNGMGLSFALIMCLSSLMLLTGCGDGGKAAYEQGLRYQKGDGVEKNLAEAMKWVRKAAEQGFAPAQSNLGWCFLTGRGINKDFGEAIKWFRKAAEQGDAEAQIGLGVCYRDGLGTKINPAESVKWFRKAAEQGNAAAQYGLGICYEHGKGVEKNLEETVKWYRKAAEQGYADAQFSLGNYYWAGEVVQKDYGEAVKWYRKSAEQNNANAQFWLGFCYFRGDGVAQDYAEAVKWYRKAAEQGHSDAQFELGLCYGRGEGVSKNVSESVTWVLKSAEQGNKRAISFMQQLKSEDKHAASDSKKKVQPQMSYLEALSQAENFVEQFKGKLTYEPARKKLESIVKSQMTEAEKAAAILNEFPICKQMSSNDKGNADHENELHKKQESEKYEQAKSEYERIIDELNKRNKRLIEMHDAYNAARGLAQMLILAGHGTAGDVSKADQKLKEMALMIEQEKAALDRLNARKEELRIRYNF